MSKGIGEEWIRTTVGRSQQIYSLPPLATRAPHQKSGLNNRYTLQHPLGYDSSDPEGLFRPRADTPGAHDGTRIRDLFLTKEVLYRLSYMGVSRSIARHYDQ